VLSAAVEDQLIKHNPAQGLGRFVKSEKPAREATSLPAGEVAQLLKMAQATLSARDHALIFTALRSGLREGELAALRWADVQFREGENDPHRYLLVQRTYDRRWSKRMLTPKSKKSRRVDMSRELRRVLLNLRREQSASMAERFQAAEALVFPSDAGTPIEMNNFYQRTFKPLVTRAGLPSMRFHDLRHTYGSLLIQSGASLAYIRDQMGHSSIQITVDVYGHLIPSANVSFADRLDSLTPTSPQQSATFGFKRISGFRGSLWE
jgi:integrase